MNIEYEATFPNVDRTKIVVLLKEAGAKLIKPTFLQRRVVFNLPENLKSENSWLRVRDESDKVTLSLKTVDGSNIQNQKELQLEVSDYGKSIQLLEALGCKHQRYEETKRELWHISVEGQTVEVTIDEWPFLNPFVEVEGPSEEAVRQASQRLNFNYSTALFGSVDVVYIQKYGKTLRDLGPKFKELKFDTPNPFI